MSRATLAKVEDGVGLAQAGPTQVAGEIGPVGLPEAPVSATVKVSYRGSYDLLLTIRGTTGKDVLTRLDAAIDHLERVGSRPTENGPQRRTEAPATGPVCPVHGKPMKAGKHGGFYCPVKVQDDAGDGRPLYCRQRAERAA